MAVLVVVTVVVDVVFVVVIVLDVVYVPFKIGGQTPLHVKPNSVELERTLAVHCEVGCVVYYLGYFCPLGRQKVEKAPSWLHLWLAFSTNAQNSKIREVLTAP